MYGIRFKENLGAPLLTGVAFLALWAGVLPLAAQVPEVTARLRLAQSFEQSGEWERAVAIYEGLFQTDPQSYVIFDGLRRGYTQLKKYDLAIGLVQQRLLLHPHDVGLLAILGGIYFQAGEGGRADSIWQLVLRTDPKNQNLYRIVASQMIEHRQYDKAVRIYLSARAATGNSDLFIEDLAILYGALLQYESAVQEYLRVLRAKPQQLSYVQARLASFTGREEGRRIALRVVESEVRKTPNDVTLLTLLSWLYIEGKQFEEALAVYRTIDRLSKANGSELFQFAQRASQEQAYAVAARAFHEVMEHSPSHNLVPYARFGFARAIEELSVLRDTAAGPALRPPREGPISETGPSFQGAISLYEALVGDFPNSDIAMQSLYRIGIIRYERFFDLDGAVLTLGQLRELPFNPALVNEATAKAGEVQTARNNLAGAREEYERLLQVGGEQFRDRALFCLAELDYFEGNFDSSLAKLGRVTANPRVDLANDALQLMYFIQENKLVAPAALGGFAGADLLMRQRKDSEALARFQEIVRQNPAAPLVDDGMMKMGELFLRLQRSDEALEVFKRVANEMPTSILRDRAQMRVGEIYETIKRDRPLAIDAYERLLQNHPTSLYVEEARRRIRTLRGDAI